MQSLLRTSADPLPLGIAGISPESFVTRFAGTKGGAFDKSAGLDGADGDVSVGPGWGASRSGGSGLPVDLTAAGSEASSMRSSGSPIRSGARGVRGAALPGERGRG